MTELWLGPDLNPDLVPLVEQPEEWAQAREATAILQMFEQQIGATHENEFGVGVNYYARLADHGFFRKLVDLGLKLAFEVPGLKAWSVDGQGQSNGQAEFAVKRMINNVLAAGGAVSAYSLDDPLCAALYDMPDSPWPLERAVAPVCHVLQVGDDFGIWQAPGRRGGGITEAYPRCSADQIIDFFGMVQQAGFSPGHLHLDVDEQHAKQVHTDTRISQDFEKLQYACTSWGIPFGIILNGQRGDDPASYRAGFEEWFAFVRRMLLHDPDRYILESWKASDPATRQPNGLPVNLPEGNPYTHTGLLLEVAHALGFPFSETNR